MYVGTKKAHLFLLPFEFKLYISLPLLTVVKLGNFEVFYLFLCVMYVHICVIVYVKFSYC